VGGGLGPFPTRPFAEFLPQELLPIAVAIARVYTRLGEKKNRNTARIKFLVHKLGIEEFRRLVLEERAQLPHDPKWTEVLDAIPTFSETALRDPSLLQITSARPEGFEEWHRRNVYQQRQAGYATITVSSSGDITPSSCETWRRSPAVILGPSARPSSRTCPALGQ
jgi:sulfite reductase (ferredoxin)